MKKAFFLFVGFLFGIAIVKSEALSWFRIQEMFRFQSIHMFGIFGSAVFIGSITVFLIKKFRFKSIEGETIRLANSPNGN